MLDVKTWLESTGLPVEFVSFEKAPALPFIAYLENSNVYGSDSDNFLIERDLTIELYAKRPGTDSESLIEQLLDNKAFEYQKSTVWLPSERCHMIVYNFKFTERK